MKQRADACAAKFFRPKLVQVIEWKLNSHAEVLAQPIHCCDAVVAPNYRNRCLPRRALYNFARIAITTIPISVTPTQNFANNSPCST
jgi:hypothetical protein